jgi:hypothetical protein
MPTTRPAASNSGPPELPGLTAASVWMNGTTASPGSERPLALTMPCVAVCSKPNGAPIASTQSPTCTALASPRFTVGRFLASIFSTAMSVAVSLPSTRASNSRRSASLTVTRLASRTTCALVSTSPSLETMNPEPWPRNGDGPCGGMRKPGTPRKKRKNGSLSNGVAAVAPSSSPSLTLCKPETVTPTTAGPALCTMAR